MRSAPKRGLVSLATEASIFAVIWRSVINPVLAKKITKKSTKRDFQLERRMREKSLSIRIVNDFCYCIRHCELAKQSRILYEFLNLFCEILPFRIQYFYEFKFLSSISSFQLFFSHDSRCYIFKIFIIYTEFTVIFFRESLNDSILMLFYSSEKITCHSNIECSISFTCHNVDISGFHSGIFLH